MRIYSLLTVGLLAVRALAQDGGISNNTTDSVVTVFASDASASETGPNTGAFSIHRTGPTNNALAVFFALGGTAGNGVDYEAISNNNVVIPMGERSARILITPTNDTLVEGNETVVIRLMASPLASPLPQYRIGSPAEALITISDNDSNAATNHPPVVAIASPGNNAAFTAPANITIIAHPYDSDGFITKVEFFAGSNSLGVVMGNNTVLGANSENRWSLTWSNVPAGSYSLRAIATDDDGASGASAPVNIIVREPELRPTISVYAGDRDAAEATNGGSFRFVRSGNTNVALSVHYSIGGTASNGVDYESLSGAVEIPAGVVAVAVPVTLIDDSIVEGQETVTIKIDPVGCIAIFPPPPECYLVGSADRATVEIRDNDTEPDNSRPTVRMLAPANGATFTAPADIALRASAQDREDGNNITVEFFAGTNRIGAGVFVPTLCPSPDCPFFALVWSNVPPGEYALRAKATDQAGLMGWSEAVKVLVRGTNTPPPETNHPPVVKVHAADAYAVEGPTIQCWTNTWLSNSVPRDGTPIGAIDTNILATNFTSVYCRTNNETNAAVFKITRSGPTNDALTVNYSLCGTASNGVDYVELPGTVTIPAGRRAAEIVVMPIDDALAEGIETVVLMLTPSSPDANAPAPYALGWPDKAGAIIVDNDVPRPPTGRLHDALFHLCAPATNGFNFRLEMSTNLVHWIPVFTNRVMDGAVQFVDPESAGLPNRFYRWIEDPNTNPE